MAEPWLSADDIAAHLGVTKDTVYTWIAEKAMPAQGRTPLEVPSQRDRRLGATRRRRRRRHPMKARMSEVSAEIEPAMKPIVSEIRNAPLRVRDAMRATGRRTTER